MFRLSFNVVLVCLLGSFALYHLWPYITVPGLEEYRQGISTQLDVFPPQAEPWDLDTAGSQGFAADIGLAEAQVDPIYGNEVVDDGGKTFEGEKFDDLLGGG